MESKNRARDDSIDVLRGVVMVLMALDHTRDFFGDSARDPTDLAHTDALLFFTRWITHFCAPVFVLLAGVSAWISSQRRTGAEASRQLVTRGLWLVLLELTVVRFGWLFDLSYRFSFLQVIWVIGWSMVGLALVSRAGVRATLVFGVAMVALHNLLDGVSVDRFGQMGWLWRFLHQPGRLEPLPDHMVYVAYPLIPWIGVMAVGYGIGPRVAGIANDSIAKLARRRFLLGSGLVMVLLFIALRAGNFYGEARHWHIQSREGITALSFLNCTKYPPSLDYLLMTLGPAALIWGALSGRDLSVAKPIMVFGRVPLFYYILHLLLLHSMAKLWLLLHGGMDAVRAASTSEHGTGGSLRVVYGAWLLGVLLLWPICRWFDGVKTRHRGALWTSYI